MDALPGALREGVRVALAAASTACRAAAAYDLSVAVPVGGDATAAPRMELAGLPSPAAAPMLSMLPLPEGEESFVFLSPEPSIGFATERTGADGAAGSSLFVRTEHRAMDL